MRTKDVTKALASGVVVYVLMAACAADPIRDRNLGRNEGSGGNGAHGDGVGGETGSGSNSGASGGMLAELDAMVDAVGDAITDPVPDAGADPNTSGSRLRARYYAGDDGSRQFMGWRDTERDEDCSFSRASDNKLRCLPGGSVTVGSYFSDAGCTKLVGIAAKDPGCGVADHKYAVRYASDDGCTLETFIFSVSAVSAPSKLYTGTPAACGDASSLLTSYDVFSLTEIALSSFVAATEEVE